jgi:hypothetical protein
MNNVPNNLKEIPLEGEHLGVELAQPRVNIRVNISPAREKTE